MSEIIAFPVILRSCKGCGEEKPLSGFYKHKASKDGYVRKCKNCYINQRRNVKTGSIEGRLTAALWNAKESSQLKNRAFDISLDDLLRLWTEQKGFCRYSGVPMTWDDSNRYTTVSLDRIDSSKGYIPSNIALCCVIVNVMKNQMPLEHLVWWCQNIVSRTKNV